MTTENNVAAQAGDEPMPCTCPSGDGSLRWPCPQHPPELDVVVEANRALLHARSQLGIKKYGGTLDTMRHSRRALLQHALEEALDLANYLQADIQAIDREAPQVSPRATADVERDAEIAKVVWQLISDGVLDHVLTGSDESGHEESFGSDTEEMAYLLASIKSARTRIATTNPGS